MGAPAAPFHRAYEDAATPGASPRGQAGEIRPVDESSYLPLAPQVAVAHSVHLKRCNAALTPAPLALVAARTEWTSFDHPDPTGEQLRCMQRQVLHMLDGSAADVEPTFADKFYLPSGASVSGAEWKKILDEGHVYIWLDYSSVPVRPRHLSTLAGSRSHTHARCRIAPRLTARARTASDARSKSGPTTTGMTRIQMT